MARIDDFKVIVMFRPVRGGSPHVMNRRSGHRHRGLFRVAPNRNGRLSRSTHAIGKLVVCPRSGRRPCGFLSCAFIANSRPPATRISPPPLKKVLQFCYNRLRGGKKALRYSTIAITAINVLGNFNSLQARAVVYTHFQGTRLLPVLVVTISL